MAEIVILGAGLTGLSVAYHLEKKGFFDYKLFEKESSVGGLCRSVSQDGFIFDYTGHLLHVNDAYLKQFIESVVGFDQFNTIERRSAIYSQNCYTEYPYQINLHGLPAQTIIECIEGFIERPQIKKTQTFYSWVLKNFGVGFARHFFFPYQQKIFDYDVKKLSSSWTGRFVPATSLNKILWGAFTPHRHEKIGYNSQFFYPRDGGIIRWVQKIADMLINPIMTHHTVQAVDLKHKIIFFTNGHYEQYKQLISTIPLDNLLGMIKESTTTLYTARSHLRCASVINFNIGINKPSVSDNHWIYYPEKKYPFYRIGFSHNFSSSMAPHNCSSLYGEFSITKKRAILWETMINNSRAHAMKLFNFSHTDILTEKIIHIPHAYVIYNSWRDRNVPRILQQLQEQSLFSIGRYGAWKYSSMQEAVLDGKTLVDQLIIIPAQQTYDPLLYNQTTQTFLTT